MRVSKVRFTACTASFEGNPLGPGDYHGALRINYGDASLDISNYFESADVSFEARMGSENAGMMHVKRAEGPIDLGDLVSGPENKSVGWSLPSDPWRW